MRRTFRYLSSLSICLAATAGCDLFKDKAVDAGSDGAVTVTPAITEPAPADTTLTPAATTVAPLNPATPTTPTSTVVQPTVKTDGGAVADSGAKADGAAPTPTPVFPVFDASALQGFDAGGLFNIPDGGFKPPWQK